MDEPDNFSTTDFKPAPISGTDKAILVSFISQVTAEMYPIINYGDYTQTLPLGQPPNVGKPAEDAVETNFNLEQYVANEQADINPTKVDGEESVDSNGYDRGYIKRLQPNLSTRRPNQLLECKYCGKTYTKLYNIKDHIHMHRGQAPYQCKYCGKRFSQMANRNRHENKVCAMRNQPIVDEKKKKKKEQKPEKGKF